MKRIVFISCRCTSKSVDSSYDDDEEMTEEMMDNNQEAFYSVDNLQATPAPINTMIG